MMNVKLSEAQESELDRISQQNSESIGQEAINFLSSLTLSF